MKSQSTLFQGAKRLNNVLLGIETFFMALITIALVAAIFIEVICRYFLFISAAWAEELTRYLCLSGSPILALPMRSMRAAIQKLMSSSR